MPWVWRAVHTSLFAVGSPAHTCLDRRYIPAAIGLQLLGVRASIIAMRQEGL